MEEKHTSTQTPEATPKHSNAEKEEPTQKGLEREKPRSKETASLQDKVFTALTIAFKSVREKPGELRRIAESKAYRRRIIREKLKSVVRIGDEDINLQRAIPRLSEKLSEEGHFLFKNGLEIKAEDIDKYPERVLVLARLASLDLSSFGPLPTRAQKLYRQLLELAHRGDAKATPYIERGIAMLNTYLKDKHQGTKVAKAIQEKSQEIVKLIEQDEEQLRRADRGEETFLEAQLKYGKPEEGRLEIADLKQIQSQELTEEAIRKTLKAEKVSDLAAIQKRINNFVGDRSEKREFLAHQISELKKLAMEAKGEAREGILKTMQSIIYAKDKVFSAQELQKHFGISLIQEATDYTWGTLPPDAQADAQRKWELMDEASDEFSALPDVVKRLIQGVNDTAKTPRGLTDHYLGEIISRLDRIYERGEIDRETQKELKDQIGAKREEIARAGQRRKQEQAKRQYARRTGKSIEEIEQLEQLEIQEDSIRQEVYSLNNEVGRRIADPEDIQEGRRSRKLHDLVVQARMVGDKDELEEIVEIIKAIDQQTLIKPDRELVEAAINLLDKKNEYLKIEEQLGKAQPRGGYYERYYGSHPEIIRFFRETLSNPEEIARIQTDRGFKHFENRVKRAFNILFEVVDSSTDQPFDSVFTSLYEMPVYNDIIRMLQQAERHIRPRNETLSGKLEGLRRKLTAERKLRRYTHNVAFILQTRGNLETLHKFAEDFVAGELDFAFKEDPMVLQAVHFLEQKVNQKLADNNWVVPQDFMQPIEGRIEVDEEVIKMLENYYKGLGIEVEDWEIPRAYRIAKGISVGVTAIVLDRIAEADPPGSGEMGRYKSYYGESLMSAWNPMRHFFYRWGNPDKFKHLLYSVVGHKGGVWRHKDPEKLMAELEALKGTYKMEFLGGLGGKPMIEVMNLFGVGGVLSRGGWRMDAATYHLLEDAGLYSVGSREQYDKVDWNRAWENLKRAGSGTMYYWASIRAEKEADALGLEGKAREGKIKELQRKYKIEVFEHIKKVNPLKFALYEKELMDDPKKFSGSIRGKALKFVEDDNIRQAKRLQDIQVEVALIEEDLILVQEFARERAKESGEWGVKEEDFKQVIKDPKRRKKAMQYWRGLMEAVDDSVISNFAERDIPYFIGSEDLDFTQLKFGAAGQSIIGRVFGDAHHLSEGVGKLFGFDQVLIEASRKKDFSIIVDAIHEIAFPITGVHGSHKTSKVARELATIAARFYQKDIIARMPLGIGTVWNIFKKSAISEEFIGRGAWQWDEDTTFDFINAMRHRGDLLEEDANELKAEIGARDIQAVYDIMRTAVPLIVLLLMIEAMRREVSD